jgi:pimeloyl-ACP methyl ester carboxylesterase
MSQGARVAMRATRQLAARLSCLILDGAPNDDATISAGEQEIPLERYRHLVSKEGIEAFRREWVAHPLMQLHAGGIESLELLQSILAGYMGKDLLMPQPIGAAGPLGPITPGEISIPTLVLNGELDEGRRLIGDGLCAALPCAQRAVIAGAGHLPNLDKPREYTEALIQFIERHRRGVA